MNSSGLPLGFKVNAVYAGIKKTKKLDLALIYSCVPAKAAGVFTANSIKAAPVIVSSQRLKKRNCAQAIIINSGNANCFTGRAGISDSKKISSSVAKELGVYRDCVLIASTGLIGRRLAADKIKKAIPELVKGLSRQKIDLASQAIMTTDKVKKRLSVKLRLGKSIVKIAAIAKGAGMIYPQLGGFSGSSHRHATMLCFIATDAAITSAALKQALNKAVDKSYNCISVDGCTSTNDTVIILANAEAKNTCIDKKSKYFSKFSSALNYVCLQLAKQIVRDAEGATKFVKIKVSGARNTSEAKEIGFSIANSLLFKTAVYGQDPNWGRIVQAIGVTRVAINPQRLKINFSSFKKKNVCVNINLNAGSQEATVYTCDLTPEYIRINTKYN